MDKEEGCEQYGKLVAKAKGNCNLLSVSMQAETAIHIDMLKNCQAGTPII